MPDTKRNNEPPDDLSARLRAWRARWQMSQTRLADLLSVPRLTLVRWEQGHRTPHATMLELAMYELSAQLNAAGIQPPVPPEWRPTLRS